MKAFVDGMMNGFSDDDDEDDDDDDDEDDDDDDTEDLSGTLTLVPTLILPIPSPDFTPKLMLAFASYTGRSYAPANYHLHDHDQLPTPTADHIRRTQMTGICPLTMPRTT